LEAADSLSVETARGVPSTAALSHRYQLFAGGLDGGSLARVVVAQREMRGRGARDRHRDDC
jgi:hypothetical protein